MSLYFYAPKLYPGTRELVEALQAKRLVRHDGMNYLHKGVPIEFSPKDVIVGWGGHAPAIPNVRCLNASYEYPTMFDANYRGFNKLSTAGYAVFTITPVSDAIYQATLEPSVENWWPKRAKPSKLVGLHEFPGYCTTHYGFDKLAKTTVFCGQFLDGDAEDVPYLVKLLDQLKLDFATFYYGKRSESIYIVKLLTAPALNAQGVALFAEKIADWIARG